MLWIEFETGEKLALRAEAIYHPAFSTSTRFREANGQLPTVRRQKPVGDHMPITGMV